MLVRQWINFAQDGITTKVILENIAEVVLAQNNICLIISGHAAFLNDVSIMFIDKTDPSDPLKREDYWRRTLKPMAPFG